jgi:hypothetical protein
VLEHEGEKVVKNLALFLTEEHRKSFNFVIIISLRLEPPGSIPQLYFFLPSTLRNGRRTME